MANTIIYTIVLPTSLSGTKTGNLYSPPGGKAWQEGPPDRNVIIEPIPGWSAGIKFISGGNGIPFVAHIYFTAADTNALRVIEHAWTALRSTQGTVAISQYNYTPTTYSNMTLRDEVLDRYEGHVGLITLSFVQGGVFA